MLPANGKRRKSEATAAAATDARWDKTAQFVGFDATEEPGAEFRNTAPSSSISTCGGWDTVEYSLFGQWSLDKWDDLVKTLDEAKQEAADKGEIRGTSVIELGEGDRVEISGNGAAGGSDLRLFYRWVITTAAIRIKIVNRREYNENQLSVAVKIGSDVLMSQGLDWCIEHVDQLLRACGFDCVRSVVSRADACVDLVDVDVADLVKPAMSGHAISKMTKVHTDGTIDRIETLRVGSSNSVTMYDKLKEAKKDPDKFAIMVARRWGGSVPKAATRVEFRLRRELLQKQFGVRTLEQLREQQQAIVWWCSRKYYRIAGRIVDRANKNQSKAGTHALWLRVQSLFDRAFGELQEPHIKPIRRNQSNTKMLRKQARGVIASILSLSTTAIDSVVDLHRELVRELDAFCTDHLLGQVLERRASLAAATALGDPVELDPATIPF